MAFKEETVMAAAAATYQRAIKKAPEDLKRALRKAVDAETTATAKAILQSMLLSLDAAEADSTLLCADVGIPTYYVSIGTKAAIGLDLAKVITEGYERGVNTAQPPVFPLATNPMTQERSHSGKGTPAISFDLIPDADWIEMVCAPQGFGSEFWANMQFFNLPTVDVIEKFILDSVLRAGSKPCPPFVVGVGIGGGFDKAARMARLSLLRHIGERSSDPKIALWEDQLLNAVNQTGIGPMGLGGNTTALAVNVEVSSGHSSIPVAVCFNCWPNRRMRARIHSDGRVDYYE